MYSLWPILLFANTDVSMTKMPLDTSELTKSIMGQREYLLLTRVKIFIKIRFSMKDLGKTKILGIDVYEDRSRCKYGYANIHRWNIE
jgi:hypothetical protein